MAKLLGVDSNWITDIIIGTTSALALLLLSVISPGIATIGIPSVSASISGIGKGIIIIILAPIFETILFQGFINDFFYSKLSLDKFKGIGYFISAIIASLLFSSFHATAYTSLSAMGGSFVSAFLVAVVFQYSSKWTNSLITPVIMHSILNFYILSKLTIIIG
ncbi:MAG: CPBP family intramembrane metalloprotease [Proteobacteria bacterium]|nr:CPBP family intramembrane metalloprotease [Pseudomonadota bacterium]